MIILHVEPDRYDSDARRELESAGVVDYEHCSSQQDFLQALRRKPYDCLVARLGLSIDAEAMAAAPKLRWIATPTTGVDHIDLDAAERAGITVLSLRGEEAFLDTIRSTAEHTWALLTAVMRRIIPAHADVLSGHWRRAPFLGEELAGKTLGILGLGRLGRMVAGYGTAFGMRVLAHDSRPEQFARAPVGVEAVGLDALLTESDVVSVHLPLNDETTGFLGTPELRALKHDAMLINTSRGEIVNEGALLSALLSGSLGGAGLDVLAGDARWDSHSPPAHPLVEYARTHDNLLLTPHIGGYGRQSIASTRQFIARRVASAILANREST